MPGNVLELESSIKQLPGVLGCVIMTDARGAPAEIQAFVRMGAQQADVRQAILEEAGKIGLEKPLRQVLVFELDAESHFGDRESLERAAAVAEQEARARGPVAPEGPVEQREQPAPRRPLVERVVLTSSSWTSASEVALRLEEEEIVGTAEGEKTPHGLKVVAQATLGAAHKLVGGTRFHLEGASLVNIVGRDAVLVLVRRDDGLDTLGAALIRNGPVSEVAVRATLAAINRRLSQELA